MGNYGTNAEAAANALQKASGMPINKARLAVDAAIAAYEESKPPVYPTDEMVCTFRETAYGKQWTAFTHKTAKEAIVAMQAVDPIHQAAIGYVQKKVNEGLISGMIAEAKTLIDAVIGAGLVKR